MTLRDLQPEAVDALDAVELRADAVTDPELLALVRAHVEHIVADGPAPREPVDSREAALTALVDQMLLDVASVDDAVVRAAAADLPPEALPDLVMASYAWEARTRLSVMAGRLLGGIG